MEKYDASQLTEFPRFEPESAQNSVSTFFNKFLKFPLFTPSEGGDPSSNKSAVEEKQAAFRTENQSKEENEGGKTETGTYAVELEGRSLPNVLRRISSLVALGSGGGTRYADTELARYWMPDDISRECYECASRFSTLRRRHHCRVCGQIFCSRCCSQRVPGHIFGCNGGLRVCNYCCNVVLSYLKENDLTGDISPDLKTLQENLQVKFPDNIDQASKTSDNFVFAHDQEDRCEIRNSPKETLQDVFRHLSFALPTQQHSYQRMFRLYPEALFRILNVILSPTSVRDATLWRPDRTQRPEECSRMKLFIVNKYRLVSYNGVWRGCDILQWIMDNTNNKTRVQANMVCQSLLSSGYMECVTDLPQFADYALYRPIAVTLRDDDDEDDDVEPEERTRLVESVSSYCLDLNLGNSSARLIKTPKAEKKSSSSEEEAPIIEQSELQSEGSTPGSGLAGWGAEHLRLVLRQSLARHALPPAWLDTLLPLCTQAAETISLDPSSNDIDVRNYVQVKKVPGGSPKDSCLINGVVFTKNVAHRGMPQYIAKPTILLLDCSIAYQRVEGKLTSLEPVLMQEQEYLMRCGARIAALAARVVLVRGGAGGAVRGAVRGAGAALATRVPPRALRRAARCARADLLASLDARIGHPRLGSCDAFYVRDYGSKTLMILEGCPESHLGCCILLRGASLPELIRVKKVVKFMLLACYNWKLEKAFFEDIEAVLPEPGMTFDDEINEDEKPTFAEDSDDTTSQTIPNPKEDTKIMQTEISNDIFTNESLKSNEANSDLFHNLIGTSKTDIKESFEISSTEVNENASTKNDAVASTENNEVTSSVDTEVSSTENVHDRKVAHAENTISICRTRDFSVEKTSAEKNVVTSTKNTEASRAEKAEVCPNTENAEVTSITSNTNSIGNDVDDPLQRPKSYTKKTENSSCGVPIKDFSDPLRATLSVDDDVFLPKEEASFKADVQNERWTADDVVLSMSPSVVIPAPYLTTEAGRRCPLRRCFPAPLLQPRPASRPPPPAPPAPRPAAAASQDYHPFVRMAIKTPSDDPALKAALASYRATGGRRSKDEHKPWCPQHAPSIVPPPPPPPPPPSPPAELDPFSPESHQRLHLLLYSYSSKSPNVPDFCVNPWTVVMEMYGKHDITLGAFLEKYCFNGDYKCTSNTCHIPMNQHVRRFVHNDVCISITCNTIGHSSVDKHKEDQSNQVAWWWRCERCGAGGRARALSARARALSLAQYLRWRASPARPPRARACSHALHAATHAFRARHTTATFRYSKIKLYDIVLPPDMISTNYDTKQMRETLIAQLNELMLKGHETFNNVGSGEADKEYQAFKHHMESLHVALTSPALQDPDTDAVIRTLWNISDGIIFGEKMLRDAQDMWSSAATKPVKQPTETPVEDKSDIDESSGEASGNENAGTTYVFSSESNSKESDKEHTGNEEDEEKGDKKTVRQILSQLLSNNQPANQEQVVVVGGLVPVAVSPSQTGAVIAAALASVAYRRARAAQRHSTQTESEEADTNAANKEKNDGEKSKPAAKSNDHVEVLLKEGLMCRVYYAAQFEALRHAVIQPRGKDFRCCCDSDKKLCNIEEGFIRSVAQCEPWAAGGGKSGSTFCKTKDDRYVLKEMTKPEWQQFLEFAPHYFNYVTSCRQKNVPSLLARMVGVFAVGGAGSGVLVLEHVWYGCGALPRFDLKGCARHRLRPAHDQVLMDENLLNLRWERPLHVRGWAGRALRAAAARDAAFLAAHHVMDYSLLLALGDHSLVLGLIDYIRTFTWDKKLEHLVKKNLGSGQPTVVSPEQYMKRFCDAIRKYFLQCPEHWDHLYDVLPSMLGQ